VLLSGEEETDITDYLIESAFPTRAEVRKVLQALETAPAGLSEPELMGKVNLSNGRIEKTIALLSLESPAPVARQGTKWQLTAANLSETFWQRADRLTELRRGEQRQMQEYVRLPSGHMEFLIRALDGDPGTVRPPSLPPLPTDTDPVLVREAVAFLRRTSLPIEPRRQWPAGGMSRYRLTGRIAAELQARPGRALCVWGDAGWGSLVRDAKYRDGHFADELVGACAVLMREWNPQPSPAWVTCIPSRRHPELVPNFARRLAAALKLPFHVVLEKTDDRPEQKTMANSTQQARNIDGSLRIITEPPHNKPSLLVDDMVDSRWTLTVAAWLLRSNGSG
jgi:ATP-dependent DNA helicase RecQ